MKNKSVILVADPQPLLGDQVKEQFGRVADVLRARTVSEAIEQVRTGRVRLVLCSLNLSGDRDGLEILDAVKGRRMDIPVVVIAESPDIDACKQAIRGGAWDFIVRPLSSEQLRSIVEQTVPASGLRGSQEDFTFPGVVSRSPSMQTVFRVLRRVAPTTLSVLIEGESGTGKEMTARAIHDNSARKDGPFYPLNCAGLTESLLESELFGHVKGAFTGAVADRKGLFQLADNGTLFLDEIGDMPLPMQAKLLRVLEDGLVRPVGAAHSTVVDVRIISATNHDLARLVEEKKFRQDLYFRIKEAGITLPPLRQRPQDIPELFGYFLREATREIGRDIHLITEPAMRALMNYTWPGNIRQLRNVVRTMVVMCERDTLDLPDLPIEISRVRQLEAGAAASALSAGTVIAAEEMTGRPLVDVEKEHIRRTLELTRNNRAEAARILQIGERTLYRKIKEYNL
jgi:DNA-binding NtrC family response regulator